MNNFFLSRLLHFYIEKDYVIQILKPMENGDSLICVEILIFLAIRVPG